MHEQRITLKCGDLSDIGQIAVCAWCSYASACGDHVWLREEDCAGSWACADEDACHARFEATS